MIFKITELVDGYDTIVSSLAEADQFIRDNEQPGEEWRISLEMDDDVRDLFRWAKMLAYIMRSEDDRDEVYDSAEHVWRVIMSREEHKRLMVHDDAFV